MAKDILFAAFFTASKQGKTGLADVAFDVFRTKTSDLSNTQVTTAGAATVLGDGLYAYRYPAADLQTYYYYAVAKTADSTVDYQHLPAVQLDFSDASINPINYSLLSIDGAGRVDLGKWLGGIPGALSGGSIPVMISNVVALSPSQLNSNLTLIIGDDYYSADSRAIKFTDTGGVWPDLTTAGVVLTVVNSALPGTVVFTVTGTVNVPTGSNKAVSFDIPASKTNLLALGTGYAHGVVATLNDGHIATLARGIVKSQTQNLNL